MPSPGPGFPLAIQSPISVQAAHTNRPRLAMAQDGRLCAKPPRFDGSSILASRRMRTTRRPMSALNRGLFAVSTKVQLMGLVAVTLCPSTRPVQLVFVRALASDGYD